MQNYYLDYQLLLILLFGFGILAQAALSTTHVFNPKTILWCMAISLIAFLPGKGEENYDLYVHVFFSFILFSTIFSVIFKKDLLPMITEQTVFSYNIVFLYILLTRYNILNHYYLLSLIAIPTLLTFLFSIVNEPLDFLYKALSYIWFITMVVFLIGTQYSFSVTFALLNSIDHRNISPWDAFLTGMTFIYLFFYLYNLLALIPLPGKRQSLQERIRELKNHIALLASKYSDLQMNIQSVMLITVILTGLLAMNRTFSFISDSLLISLLILILPRLTSSTKKSHTFQT